MRLQRHATRLIHLPPGVGQPVGADPELSVFIHLDEPAPPLRTLHAPSPQLANAQAFANNAQVIPPMLVPAGPR